MKALILAAVIMSSFAVHADEIVTRSEHTGNDKVFAVGNCGLTTEVPNLNQFSTEFSYSVCSEIKTYQARKIKDSTKTWNKTRYEAIAGTEVLTYAVEMRQNGDRRSKTTNQSGTSELLNQLESARSCQSLASAMRQAVVNFNTTGCAK